MWWGWEDDGDFHENEFDDIKGWCQDYEDDEWLVVQTENGKGFIKHNALKLSANCHHLTLLCARGGDFLN